MITPCAHSRIIKTPRYRVVKRIQRRGILDSFYRQLFNLFIGVNGKVYPSNARGDWACECRHCAPVAPRATFKKPVRSRWPRRVSNAARNGKSSRGPWSNFFSARSEHSPPCRDPRSFRASAIFPSRDLVSFLNSLSRFLHLWVIWRDIV